MKLSEIILEDEYTLCEADKDAEIKKIATRPEDVEESTLLILPNISKFKELPSFKIPPIAIASEKTDILPAEVRKIELKDARATVAYAYFRFYKINTSSFKTIAITGTSILFSNPVTVPSEKGGMDAFFAKYATVFCAILSGKTCV